MDYHKEKPADGNVTYDNALPIGENPPDTFSEAYQRGDIAFSEAAKLAKMFPSGESQESLEASFALMKHLKHVTILD